MPSGTLRLFQNIRLPGYATAGMTSTIGEPSVANRGTEVLVTGNWYAALSGDSGTNWQALNPFLFFPPVDGGFCCDQTLLYIPSHDVTVWLLQYSPALDTNTLRVAVKRGPLGVGSWYWWDLQPVRVNPQWQGEWFDYNHAAASDNFLYIVTNAFTVEDTRFTRCVVFRVPLEVVAGGGNFNFTYFQTFSFSLRCTPGAREVMYFGSHNSLSQIRLFSWPENSGQPTQRDVNVSPWRAGTYVARCPDGSNWLGRCDARITGGWVADGVIGFLWTANQLGSRPFPYVRAVRLEEASKKVLDEPDLWSTSYAYAYPDAFPNDRGEVGITLFRGGGSRYPDLLVGLRDAAAGVWSLLVSRNGTNGPADNKWGDYVTCRRHSPDGLTWAAVGFTLQGGGTRYSIVPQLVHFGM